MLEIADRITVLRRGKKIETVPREGATEESLARLMVGREVLLRVEKAPATPGEPLLVVEDLHVLDDRGLEAVRGVSFEVQRRRDRRHRRRRRQRPDRADRRAHRAAPGQRRARRVVGGEEVDHATSAREPSTPALGHIPEDRQRRGLVLDFTLAENLALHDYDKEPFSKLGWLCPGRLIARARELLAGVRRPRRRPEDARRALSGGNQQKVVVAREVARDPRVLIAAQPTRGLDVGAIEFVHRRLVEERDEGRAVLLVSLELDEVLSLSDRILVIYEGEIVGEYAPDVTEEELGIAMTGGRRGQGGGVSDGRDRPAERAPGGAARTELVETPGRPEHGDDTAERSRRAWPLCQRAGGIIMPLLTALFASSSAALVVLVTTGHNPLRRTRRSSTAPA